MELRQLRHFLMVAEHGNFHRAAAALNITQQALSASIAKLELSVGATLFDRGPNGVALTAFGQRLTPRAQLICSESRRVEQEIRELQDAQTGTVRIGAGAFFLERLLPPAIAGYVQAHPQVDITVVEGVSQELFGMLCRGEIDFSLSTPVAGLEPPYELDHEALFTMSTAVLMRKEHPLARNKKLSLDKLVGWPWIVAQAYDGQRLRLQEAFIAAELPPPTRLLRTDSISIIKHLLLEDDYLMMNARAPGTLNVFPTNLTVSFDVPELAGSMPAILAWRRASSMLPAASRFLSHIKRTYRKLAGAQRNDK